jgi:hypothetical protein
MNETTASASAANATGTEQQGGTGGLLLAVRQLSTAHNRHEAERSDITSSQNSAGDDGENRDGSPVA